MKILLLKDVQKVGQRGEVVEVKQGYGLNFLLKNGLGKSITEGILKDIQNKENLKKDTEELKKKNELKVLGKINKQKFFVKKNNDNGHLFAAIHQKEIAEICGVEEKNIFLKQEIKNLGEFIIKINLGGKSGKVILIVE